MERRIVLKYGRDEVALPEATFRGVDRLVPKIPPLPPSAEQLVRQRLARPAGCLPLRQLVHAGESVAVAVSDITRYSATELFLGPLLEEIDAAGIPRNRVTVYIARGTHRSLTAAEFREVAGPELSSGVRLEQSDPDGDMADLGTTSRGTPGRSCSTRGPTSSSPTTSPGPASASTARRTRSFS